MDNDTDIDYEKMLPIAYKYLNKFLGALCDDNNIGCKEWNLFTITFYRTENGEFSYDNPGVIGTGKKPIVTDLKFYPFVVTEEEVAKIYAGEEIEIEDSNEKDTKKKDLEIVEDFLLYLKKNNHDGTFITWN